MTDNLKETHILVPELGFSIESIILNGALIQEITTSIALASPNLSDVIKEHLARIRETAEEIIEEIAKYR